MSRLALALTLVLVPVVGAACVPASEELPPAGAAGFDISPSPATEGEAFTTSDGWTVRYEKLFAQIAVSASTLSRNGYGSSERYIFDARRPARVFSRALPVGPARVNLQLYGRYLNYREVDDDEDEEELGGGGGFGRRIERINVDPVTDRRFSQIPDEGQASQYTPGPSVLMVVRGERNGRVVTIDMAINVNATSTPFPYEYGTQVEVREDQLATIPKVLYAERVFPTFEDVANSDRDGDGLASAAELQASQVLRLIQQRMGAVILNL